MQIHTVKKGDTVFKIARQHSISPMKIIENNELENPDRLTVGQKLLILNPTRTYTVRGSDNLRKIAERFDVDYDKLLANNPYLYGKEKLYPGQLLAIKYDAPKYGIAFANGYCYSDTTEDRLSLIMPYVIYLTVGAGKREGNKIKILFDDRSIINEAKKNGKKVLLRVYDDTEDFSEEYLDNILKSLKEKNYDGIMIASYKAQKNSAKKYADFLLALRKLLMENDLLLFSEIDGNELSDVRDLCDGYTITYEKSGMSDIPDFESGEASMMRTFAENSESGKAYIDIPTTAYMGNEEILVSDVANLAYLAGQEILYDDEKKISYFNFNRYRAGQREPVRVAHESLENLKAKLDLIGELGYMGISFDIMKIPVEYLMMFEACFSHPKIYSDM